jgi:outer membrane protein OmpA-like peptidoglycan-associated protein
MKRFITTTTAMAMVLATTPGLPVLAQDLQQVEIDGQVLICLPDRKTDCPEGQTCVVARDPDNCERNAGLYLQALALGLTPEEIRALSPEELESLITGLEAAAAEAPAVEPADEEVPTEAPAAEEEAEAEEPVVEEPAAGETAVEETSADEPVAEETVADEAATQEAPAEEPATEEPATEEPASGAPAEALAPSEGEAALAEDAEPAFEPKLLDVNGTEVLCLPDKALPCPDDMICTFAAREKNCERNAEKTLSMMAPAEAMVAEETQVEAVEEILADPSADDPAAVDAVAATGEAEASGGEAAEVLPSDTEPAAEATVTEEVLTEVDTRSATEEFDSAPVATADEDEGLTDLELAGLVALSALVVGAMLSNGNEVVENSGDRVVVRDTSGNVTVYKDDNAILREPGTRVRTETFADGSTRTVMVREDGTQVVTIRDASGRVLRRSAYDARGVEIRLIDDLAPEDEIDVAALPEPREERQSAEEASLEDLRTELALLEAEDYAHRFSLRQIREIKRVRDLAPTIDVSNVTFDTGSAAIRKSEARKLQRLGRTMRELIEENPAEIFLIEGHTDAVGSDAYNLALSDRRAESLARALAEFYDIPPENMIVQGYGEKELKVESDSDERANRRAVVRIITPLMKASQAG